MCAMFVCWLLCNDLAHVESAHLFSQYRTQNVFYIARVAMTLSIHLWTMERELQNYLIRIWLQAWIFIYVAWNAAKILSLRHLSHLRNWLHAAAAANRLASSKRLKVSYIYIYAISTLADLQWYSASWYDWPYDQGYYGDGDTAGAMIIDAFMFVRPCFVVVFVCFVAKKKSVPHIGRHMQTHGTSQLLVFA